MKTGTEKVCPRCRRITSGWGLKRGDRCAPDRWVSCIREPRSAWADPIEEDRAARRRKGQRLSDDYWKAVNEACRQKHYVLSRYEYAVRDHDALVDAYGPMWAIVEDPKRKVFVVLPKAHLTSYLEANPRAAVASPDGKASCAA